MNILAINTVSSRIKGSIFTLMIEVVIDEIEIEKTLSEYYNKNDI